MLRADARTAELMALFIGPYAERRHTRFNGLDQALIRAGETFRIRFGGAKARYGAWVRRIEAMAPRVQAMSDRELRERATTLRPRLLRAARMAEPVYETYAIVREVTWRKLGLRHYPVQLMGGLALYEGGLAEMQTGEGKTIVALLPAVTAALSGLPVHVVTVNDYLAKRDAEALGPVFAALGLTVGLVQSGQAASDRKAAYASDVTYCTNKELVFDYLRDRIAYRREREGAPLQAANQSGGPREGFLLRGLHYAIIDEADSVLIDEARTPLIISAEKDNSGELGLYQTALDISRGLTVGQHYR